MRILACRKSTFYKRRFQSTASEDFLRRKNVRTLFLLSFLVMLLNVSFAQTSFRVSGKITQPSGEPLIGATVSEKGTTNSTLTKDDGSFTIDVANQNATLAVSYVGYATREVKVNGQQQLNLSLQASNDNLNEVVVIGYGTARRKDLTGSVASVNGKTISAIPVTNVAQAMQGKLAGVTVVSQDGRPNADVAIRVRGGGSISQSNQPLILIDGIPGNMSDVPVDQVKSIDVLKDASSSAIYGARGANGVILITTKGAQAGKTNITYSGYVKFNEPTKYLEALSPYDYLRYVWANAAANASAYQVPFEKLFGLGANAGSNTGGIESYRNLPTDDMQRLVYNSSTSSNHDLTITGGTDKTKMFFSTNYTNEQGMKLNSYLKRANVSFKISQKLFDNLTFNLDTRYTDIQDLGDEGTTSGSGSILSASYRFRPIAMSHILGDTNALRTSNIEQYGKAAMWDRYSAAARIADYEPLSLSKRLRGIVSADWRVIKPLTYHTELFLGRSWGERKYWSGAVYNNYVDDASGRYLYAGNVDYRKSDSWDLRWANTLNYDVNINSDNRLTVLVGQEVSNSGGTNLGIQANHFPSNFTKENAFAQINQYDQTNGTVQFSSNVSTPERLLSYFGRANYSLLDRYLFTVTFRADASSRFSPLHQWGYFPAGAFAWRLSSEPFMKNINWLNDLKLRFSYGEVGNDRIPSGQFIQQWGSVTDQRMQYDINQRRQSSYDFSSSTLANPDLKWETTITRDIGTDFTLFNGKLSGTVDLYWNTTKDLLTLISNPPISGFPTIYSNAGQTSNKGVELSLNGTIFKNKDWTITAGGNINFNKNNVDELSPNVTGLYGADWGNIASYPKNDYVLLKGQPVGQVRGFIYDGYYTPADFDFANGKYTLKKGVPDIGSWIAVVHGLSSSDRPSGQFAYPGLPKFKDLKEDGIIDDKDIAVIGNMVPKHTGGFNLSASYKGFDLGVFFNWSYGNDIYNANKLASLYGPKEQGVYENKLAIMNNAYKIYDVVNGQLVRLTTPDQLNAANVNATLPLAYSEVGAVSTLGIEDGSFLRLNTLSVGYSVPKSILSKARISSLRIYGSIYNLLTITNYSGLDPEVNVNSSYNNAQFPTTGLDFGTYPRPRSFVVGLNLGL